MNASDKVGNWQAGRITCEPTNSRGLEIMVVGAGAWSIGSYIVDDQYD